MELHDFLNRLKTEPETVAFADTMVVIDANYVYSPSAFSNGTLQNDAGQNEGSCKIFAFAQLNRLSETQTLHCFGDYYRNEVLRHPDDDNHQNIRQFMQSGWSGISFAQFPLTETVDEELRSNDGC